MEKHLAQPAGKQTAFLVSHKRAAGLSREQVSRCINIWANVYGLRDDSRSADLRVPTRPWTGRKLPRRID